MAKDDEVIIFEVKKNKWKKIVCRVSRFNDNVFVDFRIFAIPKVENGGMPSDRFLPTKQGITLLPEIEDVKEFAEAIISKLPEIENGIKKLAIKDKKEKE